MVSLFDPDDRRPLHFVGIGGAGMSALALAALRHGVPVTGCDADDTAFADLRAAGAVVVRGHDAGHVAGARAVVVTAAAAPTHVEVVAARAAGIPVVPRKEALAQLVNAHRLVAIAGTHGKTTTTVMTTIALTALGMRPTGLAGGRVAAWHGNAWIDGADLFVVEADEYDQAFLTLRPEVAVINNVEADHLECYGSVEAMEDAFVRFASGARRVLVGDADAGSDRVAHRIAAPVWRFGPEAQDIAVRDVALEAGETRATIAFGGGASVDVTLRVPGMHNVRNAAAALGVVVALGGDPAAAATALAEFRGVGRRFERLGVARDIAVVDDYAHHPTEVAATLAAARQAFPGRRLVAVFQPHLYSRTAAHGSALGEALASADLAIVTDVYAAREAPVAGVTGRVVADAVTRHRGQVVYHADRATLGEAVAALVRPGDTLLTLGAGDVTRVGPELLGILGR